MLPVVTVSTETVTELSPEPGTGIWDAGIPSRYLTHSSSSFTHLRGCQRVLWDSRTHREGVGASPSGMDSATPLLPPAPKKQEPKNSDETKAGRAHSVSNKTDRSCPLRTSQERGKRRRGGVDGTLAPGLPQGSHLSLDRILLHVPRELGNEIEESHVENASAFLVRLVLLKQLNKNGLAFNHFSVYFYRRSNVRQL